MSITVFFTSITQTGASFLMLSYGTPVDPHQIKTEIGPSDPKVTIHAELTRDHNDLVVTGSVQPKFGYGNPPTWRKVEIQVLSPHGHLISKSSEWWMLESFPRPCTSMRRWPFQIHLHESPKSGSAVRVIAPPV